MTTARTITFIPKMSNNTHITEAMTTSCKKRVFDNLHTNRTKKVFIQLRHGCDREIVSAGDVTGDGYGGGEVFRWFGFDDGGNEWSDGVFFHGVMWGFWDEMVFDACGGDLKRGRFRVEESGSRNVMFARVRYFHVIDFML